MTNDQWDNGGFAAGAMMNRQADTTAPQAEPPLTEDELAAFAGLATPNLDRMAQRQREVEAALRAAADLPAADAPQATNLQIQNPTSNIQNSCNQYEHDRDCEQGGSSAADDADMEPWEKRQEEREHLEEILAELDRQEEAAADAENMRTSGDEEGARATFNEEAARDRLSSMMREGDPATREDIVKRLGELDAEDAADDEVVANKKGTNREAALLEKLMIKNSGPGGEDCEAKSEETCRCAPADWKPIVMPPSITPEEARARLAQGVKVTNPLGEEVTLNNELLKHWAKEGKSEEMINARLSALPLIEEVIKTPAEIWENENGSRTYLASVLDPYSQNGKSYTVAFTKAADNTTLETYHIGSTTIGSKRKGKQLYPKKASRPPGT